MQRRSVLQELTRSGTSANSATRSSRAARRQHAAGTALPSGQANSLGMTTLGLWCAGLACVHGRARHSQDPHRVAPNLNPDFRRPIIFKLLSLPQCNDRSGSPQLTVRHTMPQLSPGDAQAGKCDPNGVGQHHHLASGHCRYHTYMGGSRGRSSILLSKSARRFGSVPYFMSRIRKSLGMCPITSVICSSCAVVHSK